MFRQKLYVRRIVRGGTTNRGFTLAEVLVTLAIIAIMAAVLLPALNQQIAKGDTGRLASDLTNIQTAAQAFVSDVHRYPTTVGQLTTSVASGSGGATSLNADGTTATIPTPLQLKWKGPYLSRESLATTGGGGTISQTFTATTSGVNSYLTISVSPASFTDFGNIESVLDDGTVSSTSSTAGNVRFSGPATSGTLTFLALPIQ